MEKHTLKIGDNVKLDIENSPVMRIVDLDSSNIKVFWFDKNQADHLLNIRLDRFKVIKID